MWSVGNSTPEAEAALQEEGRVVGEKVEAGEQDDCREHQKDLEVALGIYHLEADVLVGANHLGDDEQQKGGGRRQEKAEGTVHGGTIRRNTVSL